MENKIISRKYSKNNYGRILDSLAYNDITIDDKYVYLSDVFVYKKRFKLFNRKSLYDFPNTSGRNNICNKQKFKLIVDIDSNIRHRITKSLFYAFFKNRNNI